MVSLQYARKSQQAGAVMVVCLVFLLILTMIGISSLTANTMQLSMAGNMRQVNIAQHAAEVALRRAETQLPVQLGLRPINVLPSFNVVNGYYSLAAYSDAGVSKQEPSWKITDPTAWNSTNSVEVSGVLANKSVSKNPRYILEYLGRSRPKQSAGVTDFNSNNATSDYEYYFRITAIGWGLNGNISSILQSDFKAASDFID